LLWHDRTLSANNAAILLDPFFAIAMCSVSIGDAVLVLLPLFGTQIVFMNVEVGEEDQHKEHVSRQQILAPAREVTVQAQGVQ
jgi:hypothetical protein